MQKAWREANKLVKMASEEDTSPFMFSVLASRDDEDVNYALLQNPNLPPDIRRKLMPDEKEFARLDRLGDCGDKMALTVAALSHPSPEMREYAQDLLDRAEE